MTRSGTIGLRLVLAVAVSGVALAGWAGVGSAATIIDEWSSIKVPPPPKLEPVTVDRQTTALLLLDFVPPICNQERRPRCVASLPAVGKLLKVARDTKTMVVYSVAGTVKPADILVPLTPLGSEPVVRAHADKFIGTDLEKILKDKGIKTVIVVGTTAEGAVLYTASHAAFLGFNVVVPVDGMSAGLEYAEQYVAWDLTHAPGVSNKVKLTMTDMVKY